MKMINNTSKNGKIIRNPHKCRNNSTPTADEIRSALVGNLCRCTGYRPILEALESFASESSNSK